jgi:ribonuclease BN (tRNA processing enzyme)
VKLTVVGCAPAWTRRSGRSSSCYLVELGAGAALFDLGQGSFAELSRYCDPSAVDAVVVSHLHPDHYVDLVPLRHFLNYEAEALGSVAVFGPSQLPGRLDGLMAERGFLSGIQFTGLQPGRFAVGELEVEAAHVTHIPDSFAFRVGVAGGAGLVYSGDCGRADDLLPLVRPGDVLLCEAAYGARQPQDPVHINAEMAASVAARSGASRLVLTHVLDTSDPEAALEAAKRTFQGEVVLAEPGLRFEIG